VVDIAGAARRPGMKGARGHSDGFSSWNVSREVRHEDGALVGVPKEQPLVAGPGDRA